MKEISEPQYIADLKARADAQDVMAMYLLGIAYEEGRYVSIDEEEAICWYERASILGDVYSQLSLASLLRREAAYDDMVHWLRQAAEQNHVLAQFRLGYCNEIGLGLKVDNHEAEYWYKKAANRGDREALFRLGLLYHHRLCKCPDEGAAIRCFRRASNQGHLAATSFLGDYYEHGRVVLRDYEKAFKLYKKAAKGGFPAAQFCLGQMLQFGMGVQKSEEEGAWWISAAAEQGFVPAVYLRSMLYLHGIGVRKNTIEACKWLIVGKNLDTGMGSALANMAAQLELECLSIATEEQWEEGERGAIEWIEEFSDPEIHDCEINIDL